MRVESSATTETSVAVDAGPSVAGDTGTSAAAGTGRRRDTGPRPAAPASGVAAGADIRGTRNSGGGTLLAALGVTAFSLTFPATAWGLEGFGPWSLVAVRSALAAVLAGVCLLVLRVPLPDRRHWAGLAVVAAGVVLGFPLLTTLALRTSTTAHAAVVVGLLPLTTALFSALRMGTRPSRTFWAAALAGAAAVLAFTVTQSGGSLTTADLYLFGALLVCAAGYTEGGRLARVMPGWQVIGWALVLCLPLSVPGALLALSYEPARLTAHSVAGLVWVAAGSQFLGLVVWYRGMAAIGIPKASQLQLAQPLLTLVWSVLLLGEQLTPAAPLTAAAVLVCIAVTQRSSA
ncbi:MULTISPECIES: DMT family transporter [Streptomyces]|uniref:DMT family transporter n=1 Tax=Streptomyces TaxID=1883 RepID=UPI0018729D8F|nr:MULTISPECIES: DMT family transporter [Streptomyces]MBE4736597.1 DMT family transporter [Streptomyces caniscabiei]MBE4761857.1 DMT family transporter [Streptomyces caniscabiei]MBE4770521.1 DMT family transporter [Streptomyces caniscabiei]MBE4786376.1 DMT family transporter [Streptomyces caniscabiei]MBE4796505.1 DMT family transporter [Streptomyces caniscabiei]